MGTSHMLRTGGQILVDQLKIHGATHAFCVPGESYLPVLDALYDARETIRLVTCRQEGGAANMAEAYGKLRGRPGICFVTRGPGATNASIGVHTARQDSTPLILFVGQIARGHMEREAFQEIDYRQMFAGLSKWVTQIDDPRRIPELVARAFQTAVSGRPGPVVIALPEDVLSEAVQVADALPYQRVQAGPSAHDMARLRELLTAARRPLMFVGGSDWTSAASADIRAFAEANRLPVAATFRAQDIVNNRSDCYVGDVGTGVNPQLAQRVREADLLIVVGDRLSEIVTSDYTLLQVPVPQQTLVHVHPDPNELGRVYQAMLPLLSGMPAFARAARDMPPVDSTAWQDWTRQAHAAYLAFIQPDAMPGTLDLGMVMTYLRETLPADAIIANGAGNYTAWVHRFFQYQEYRTQLAPTNGAMGYGVPAAIAASILEPNRTVVAFAGDGCFLMTGQELATAVQEQAKLIILVVNNGMYGTIRMHQERHYPGRVIGTSLQNPDFAAYARAFGAYGEVVTRTEEFAPAFARAREANRPALLELQIDPAAIRPSVTIRTN